MLQFISKFLHGFKVEDILSEDAVEKLARASDAQQAAGAQQTADMIMGFSAAGLLWTVIFSGVGVFAFLYGKRKANAIISLTEYATASDAGKDTTMIVIVGLAFSGIVFFKKAKEAKVNICVFCASSDAMTGVF